MRSLTSLSLGSTALVLLASSCGSPRLRAPRAPAGEPTAAAPARRHLALLRESGAGWLGTLVAQRASGAAEQLHLRRLTVTASQAGDQAVTEVEHVFYNPTAERMEGTFRFPLPDSALLIGLAMEIDGKLMEGEIVERDKARRIYESIVDEMRDPALLEWEQGNVFKLRVFPIDPRREKRIVLRFLAPLRQAEAGWSYSYATAAPELHQKIDRFRLVWGGRTVVDERGFAPGREVSVALDASAAPGAALRETRKDAIYTALRVTPDWLRLGAAARHSGGSPRRLLVLLDTSRSALESRALALQTVRQLLGALRAGDRFLVTATDISCRDHAPDFVPATTEAVREALSFVSGIEADGASDLGGALRHAGRRLAKGGMLPAQVVYVGDGTATWGETEEAAVRKLARQQLGATPLFAVVLGRGASTELLQGLTGELGGRTIRPRGAAQVARFARLLRLAAELPALRGVLVTASDGQVVFPRQPTTLFEGDELWAIVRTPVSGPSPSLALTATYDGRIVTQSLRTEGATETRHIARRWAARQIAHLEATGGAKEAIVKLSTEWGVMSRHTSFLVLESEEAYRKHAIERRNAQAQARDPQVSGGDLESLRQRRASVHPDQIQPGDPEIRIPAPADARSVVVIFPFGETKIARYETALAVWTVRFLVDKSTPDGTYKVLVRITHRDGRVELMSIPYVIDTQSPIVTLTLRRTAQPGTYELRARQVVSALALKREGGGVGADLQAQVVQDAKRVEVQLPEGRVLALRTAGPGAFSGLFRPRQPLGAKVTLRVVAVDRALNRNVSSVTLEVPK
jgi:hypothetical protein